MSQPLFQATALRKHYGDQVVVNDLSFHIAPGECLGVIGPNGAGKTTTIRMCLGLTAADGGSIEALGGLSMPRDSSGMKESRFSHRPTRCRYFSITSGR